MLATVGSYGVPYIAMHMRGEPHTMMQSQYLNYNNSNSNSNNDTNMMVTEVANELNKQLLNHVNKHIPLWLQIVDPGIGFAKNYDQNIQLLQPKSINLFKKLLQHRPLLVGLSRKKFLTKIICDTYDQRMNDTADMIMNPPPPPSPLLHHHHHHCLTLSSNDETNVGVDDVKSLDNNINDNKITTSTATTNQSLEQILSKNTNKNNDTTNAVQPTLYTTTSEDSRDIATSAGCITAMMGGARILRVHNVEKTRITIDTFHTLNQ